MKVCREIISDFGSIIKYYRENKNFTLEDLSDIANVSVSYLSRLETGNKCNPSISLFFNIIKQLEIPIEKIIQVEKEDGIKELLTLPEIILLNDFKFGKNNIAERVEKIKLAQLISYIEKEDFSYESILKDISCLWQIIHELKYKAQRNVE